MRPSWTSALVLSLISLGIANAQSSPAWHVKRQLPSDLEVSGALAGLPPESTRYLAREELLAMPQVNLTVSDDSNFTGPAKIRGVMLEDLMRKVGASSTADMVVAICDDAYR